MQSTHKAFALENSGLGTFLYADVGKELNGSALTMLSMLARLGRDPWAEAARWAKLPRAGAIDSIAQSIAQMPLVPAALAETRSTAARLVQFLPATMAGALQGSATKAKTPSMPAWLPMTALYCAISLVMALSVLLAPSPPQTAIAPAEPPIATSSAPKVPVSDYGQSAAPTAAPSGPPAK